MKRCDLLVDVGRRRFLSGAGVGSRRRGRHRGHAGGRGPRPPFRRRE